MIKLSLKTSNLEYKGEGETIFGAFDDLNLRYDQIKAKGVLTVDDGEKTHEHLFPLFPLRRIFANKQTRLLWSKRLEALLK